MWHWLCFPWTRKVLILEGEIVLWSDDHNQHMNHTAGQDSYYSWQQHLLQNIPFDCKDWFNTKKERIKFITLKLQHIHEKLLVWFHQQLSFFPCAFWYFQKEVCLHNFSYLQWWIGNLYFSWQQNKSNLKHQFHPP